MNAVLYAGVVWLVLGVLVYFAARSFGGGLAGSLALALVSWPLFAGLWSVARVIWRLRNRVTPRHATIGSCFGAIAICGLGGVILLAGAWAILGVAVGALIFYLNHRTGLVTWAQVIGLERTPEPDRTTSTLSSREAWTKGLAGFACLSVGMVAFVLGAGRYFEAYSVAADYGCAHPCGMVDGLWVEVTRDSQGRVVTRVDPSTVKLMLQFRDDTPGEKTIDRSDFTLSIAHVEYGQAAGPGCDPWQPRGIQLDGTTGNLPLCFAILQEDNADLSQLILAWRQQGRSVKISLGAPNPQGFTEIGDTPSPSPS